ncbi:MAG: baseplate assembly protein [Alphaproteobacteria bacterium]|nr:MAG: baseplate assembly protein [Alphaproteobacteria bacterium]
MAIVSGSAASTAVDLSRLPPPAVVEKISFEEIYADGLARLREILPDFDATVESEPAVKMLQVFAYRETLLRQQFNDRALSVMLAFARGADLDHLAAIFGVTRLVLVEADPEHGIAEQLEDDDALRGRVVLAPESYSVAGPELAYVFHARSADAEVLDASATSPEPGQVLVSVLSRSGNGAAGAELLETVAAVVNGRSVRPLTDLVTVASAEIVEYAIEAQLFVYDGPDLSVVLDVAQASVEAYRDSAQRLGRDITISGLYASLHVEGVQRVNLVSPADNLVLGATQAPWCTGIELTAGGVGD